MALEIKPEHYGKIKKMIIPLSWMVGALLIVAGQFSGAEDLKTVGYTLYIASLLYFHILYLTEDFDGNKRVNIVEKKLKSLESQIDLLILKCESQDQAKDQGRNSSGSTSHLEPGSETTKQSDEKTA